MTTITLRELEQAYKAKFKIDIHSVLLPRIEMDPDIGATLYQMFFEVTTGSKPPEYSLQWCELNKGRKFSFWHWMMGRPEFQTITSSSVHHNRITIKRGMADPNAKEDVISMILYPYIAKGDKYAHPIIENILEMLGVDELTIIEETDR